MLQTSSSVIFSKIMEVESYLLQRLCLLLLLVAALGSSDFVPLSPPLPPLVLLRKNLKTREKHKLSIVCPRKTPSLGKTHQKMQTTTCCGSPPPHLSLRSRSTCEMLGGTVRAGAGTVGAHVGTEPVGQSLVLDGQPQLLFHDGREVGEVVQGERARRGQAGHQGGAADVSQRGTRVLQHHSGNIITSQSKPLRPF